MICKICNNEYSNLAIHIKNSHSMSAEKYYKTYYGQPKCVICGKPTKFKNLVIGYKETCSTHCSRINGAKKTKERYGYYPGSYNSIEQKQYMLNKYGVENAQQNSKIRQKTIDTNNQKYGVSYSFLTKESKEKSKINSHSKEVKNKIKKTCLKKYGETNSAKSNIVKKKARNTVLDKHNICFSEERLALSKKELKNASKIEQYFYNNLNDYTVLYNASSNKYPYLCDFYIKELDLYIELNITWTHGWHYYTESDKPKLLEMKNKNNAYYDVAIYIWTTHDLEKRDCAIKNNLNYVVVWDKNQINKLLTELETIKGFVDYNDRKLIK